jgi:hypothetical protein
MDPKSTGTHASKEIDKDGVQGEGRLAEEARKALEGPEGDALREAERLAEAAHEAMERERARPRAGR